MILELIAGAVAVREFVRKKNWRRKKTPKPAVANPPAPVVTCGGCPACRNYGVPPVPPRTVYPVPVAEPKRDLFWD